MGLKKELYKIEKEVSILDFVIGIAVWVTISFFGIFIYIGASVIWIIITALVIVALRIMEEKTHELKFKIREIKRRKRWK